MGNDNPSYIIYYNSGNFRFPVNLFIFIL